MTTNVQQLRAEVAGLEKSQAEMEAAVRRHGRVVKERRLALWEAEGNGQTLDARWLRAWLAGNHAECDRLLDLRYPDYAEVKRSATEEEKAALRAEAAQLEPQPEPSVGLVIRDEPRIHSAACLSALTVDP